MIRKLLAKAERAATPDEADAYNTKAAELMARHGVDAVMIAAGGDTRDVIGSRRIAMTDPYSTEKRRWPEELPGRWVAASFGTPGTTGAIPRR